MGENILQKIRGEYVSKALQTLPNAETSKEDLMKTVIEVPMFGLVRFRCQCMTGPAG